VAKRLIWTEEALQTKRRFLNIGIKPQATRNSAENSKMNLKDN
jgi:hypothetical protein